MEAKDYVKQYPLYLLLHKLKENQREYHLHLRGKHDNYTPAWDHFKVFGIMKKDHKDIKAGTRVCIWMVSRLGDCGITVKENPIGYDYRIDPDEFLSSVEFEPNV